MTEDGVSLLSPTYPELKGLMYEDQAGPDGAVLRRVTKPAQLLLALRYSGINVLPEVEDLDQIDGMSPKRPEPEARAYSDLSELAAAYDVVSSRHNKKLGADQVMCRIRENTHYEEYDPLDMDAETEYKAVLFWPHKCALVESLESGTPCQTALAPGQQTHASLYLALAESAPIEVAQRLEVSCANVRFVETVRRMMSLMRLLSFV